MVALQLGLQRVGLNDDRVAVGHVQHKKRAGMDVTARHVIDLRRGSAGKQESGFVTPVVEDPVEHEADYVAGDHRHFAGHVEQPAQAPDKFRIGLLPVDHFHYGVAEGRRKEMGDGGPPRMAQV